MKMYYPVAYERYGVKVLDRSYLTGVNHFTWSSSILSDSEGYRRKKPAEILNDLSSKISSIKNKREYKKTL